MVSRMVDGFEPEIIQCLGDNAGVAEDVVREQMYSGRDGTDAFLSPNYDDDPFFDDPENKRWYGKNDGYKKWKHELTPPKPSEKLGLPERPDHIPNLYINGLFHSEVFATMEGDALSVRVHDSGNAPDIVKKYGNQILQLGPTAIGYFNNQYIIPRIWRFFADCGYTPD